jgi:hypothetical protein
VKVLFASDSAQVVVTQEATAPAAAAAVAAGIQAAPASPAQAGTSSSRTSIEAVDEKAVKLRFVGGKWKLEVVQQVHQPAQLQQSPQQQQQHQVEAALRPSTPPPAPRQPSLQAGHSPAAAAAGSPAAAAKQQQQQQWSEVLLQSPVQQQLSMVRRAARHSRTSSGCSEAAQQLEQQLLDVFESTSVTSAAGGTAAAAVNSQLSGLAAAATAAAAVGRSPRKGLLFGAGSSAGAAAGAAAFGSTRLANSAVAAVAGQGDSAMSRQPAVESQQTDEQFDQGLTKQQQQQQQFDQSLTKQQQQQAVCDVWLEGQAATTAAANAASPVIGSAAAGMAAGLQDEEQFQELSSYPSAAGNASSSSSVASITLFDFTFSLHALQPLDPAELSPPAGGLNPTDPSLKPNRLVLQLGDSLYTLPPPSPKPRNASDSEGLGLNEDGEYEWVGSQSDSMLMSSSTVPLFPGYRSSLNPQGLPGFRRQLSTGHKQLPSVTKQQQLFRCEGWQQLGDAAAVAGTDIQSFKHIHGAILVLTECQVSVAPCGGNGLCLPGAGLPIVHSSSVGAAAAAEYTLQHSIVSAEALLNPLNITRRPTQCMFSCPSCCCCLGPSQVDAQQLHRYLRQPRTSV